MRPRYAWLSCAAGALARRTRQEGDGARDAIRRGNHRGGRRCFRHGALAMRAFAELYTALDETTKTSEKTEALVHYFRQAAPEDAVWAIHFLIGRRIKRLIETRKL